MLEITFRYHWQYLLIMFSVFLMSIGGFMRTWEHAEKKKYFTLVFEVIASTIFGLLGAMLLVVYLVHLKG